MLMIQLIVDSISNNDESEYNEQISEVVLWCKAHNLLLNAAKTKELIFDFRHCNISHVEYLSLLTTRL